MKYTTFDLRKYPLFYKGVWDHAYVSASECLKQYGFESAMFNDNDEVWILETEEFFIFDLLWRDIK